MLTLIYSNSANGELLPTGGENSDRKVLVKTRQDGKDLIAQWNANSRNHCKGMYHYSYLSMNPATLEELTTLDLY